MPSRLRLGAARAAATRHSTHGRMPVPCTTPDANLSAYNVDVFEECVADIDTQSDEEHHDHSLAPDESDHALIGGSKLHTLQGIAFMTMYHAPLDFCGCALNLYHAAQCGESQATHVLNFFLPWCYMLAVCESMAEALLNAAYACHQAGLADGDPSALCAADGNNACARAMKELFAATHTPPSSWVNNTDLLSGLPHLSTHIGADGGSGFGGRRQLVSHYVPSFLTHPPLDRFGRLSECMARVEVNESLLHLPISLSALSGNGSRSRFELFYCDRCADDMSSCSIVDSLKSLTGAYRLEDELENGNYAIAASVALINLVAVCCVGLTLLRCIRRGICYRMCSKSTHEEREVLNGPEVPDEYGIEIGGEIQGRRHALRG